MTFFKKCVAVLNELVPSELLSVTCLVVQYLQCKKFLFPVESVETDNGESRSCAALDNGLLLCKVDVDLKYATSRPFFLLLPSLEQVRLPWEIEESRTRRIRRCGQDILYIKRIGETESIGSILYPEKWNFADDRFQIDQSFVTWNDQVYAWITEKCHHYQHGQIARIAPDGSLCTWTWEDPTAVLNCLCIKENELHVVFSDWCYVLDLAKLALTATLAAAVIRKIAIPVNNLQTILWFGMFTLFCGYESIGIVLNAETIRTIRIPKTEGKHTKWRIQDACMCFDKIFIVAKHFTTVLHTCSVGCE